MKSFTTVTSQVHKLLPPAAAAVTGMVVGAGILAVGVTLGVAALGVARHLGRTDDEGDWLVVDVNFDDEPVEVTPPSDALVDELAGLARAVVVPTLIDWFMASISSESTPSAPAPAPASAAGPASASSPRKSSAAGQRATKTAPAAKKPARAPKAAAA